MTFVSIAFRIFRTRTAYIARGRCHLKEMIQEWKRTMQKRRWLPLQTRSDFPGSLSGGFMCNSWKRPTSMPRILKVPGCGLGFGSVMVLALSLLASVCVRVNVWTLNGREMLNIGFLVPYSFSFFFCDLRRSWNPACLFIHTML